MITHYHRPETLENALELLSQPNTIPLGGGTIINTPAFKAKDIAVVDLQGLGWTHIRKHGNNLEVDACVTLQQLLDSSHCPDALKQAIRLESPLNIRNAATVAGTLVTSDGRSPFAAMMLALDAKLDIRDSNNRISNIGEFLALRPAGLITRITIPLNVQTAYEQVSRTPADQPILCAALARWNAGRTRLSLGGWGKSPTLAMDGTEPDGLESAARNACHEAGDEIASSEYRMDVAATLARRCLNFINQ